MPGTTPTLASLRTELRARLGYAAVADTNGPMTALLNSFLMEAHEQLMLQFEWPELRRDWIFTLTPGENLYALPTDDCGYTPDPERFLGVYVQVNANWTHLPRNIDPTLYSVTASGIPTRYDIAHGNGGEP